MMPTISALKLQASKFPESATTDETKELYVQQVNNHMGLNLRVEDIQPNSAKRHLSKIMVCYPPTF